MTLAYKYIEKLIYLFRIIIFLPKNYGMIIPLVMRKKLANLIYFDIRNVIILHKLRTEL